MLDINKQKMKCSRKGQRIIVYEKEEDGSIKYYIDGDGNKIPIIADEKIGYSEPQEFYANISNKLSEVLVKEFGIDEDEMFRIAEGFGLGMGCMEMCGALSGMAMIIGLDNSKGSTKEGSKTKGTTYKKIREQVERFVGKNGSCICRELKGVDTGKVLCSCSQCIEDAVKLTEKYLAER